jgi:hypothetical protein
MRAFATCLFAHDMRELKLGVQQSVLAHVHGSMFVPMVKGAWHPVKSFDHAVKSVETRQHFGFIFAGGVRCCAIKQNGRVGLYSQYSKPLARFCDIENTLRTLPCDNVLFDGMLYPIGTAFGTITAQDAYYETLCAVRDMREERYADFYVFDMLPIKNNTIRDVGAFSDRYKDAAVMLTHAEDSMYLYPCIGDYSDGETLKTAFDKCVTSDHKGLLLISDTGTVTANNYQAGYRILAGSDYRGD